MKIKYLPRISNLEFLSDTFLHILFSMKSSFKTLSVTIQEFIFFRNFLRK